METSEVQFYKMCDRAIYLKNQVDIERKSSLLQKQQQEYYKKFIFALAELRGWRWVVVGVESGEWGFKHGLYAL